VWVFVLFVGFIMGIFIGVVNLMYESFSLLGGGMVFINMLLGEVLFGGVGFGFYGIFVFVIIVVFIVGFMVGCILEFLGKMIGWCEVISVVFYIFVMLLFVLVFIGLLFVMYGLRLLMLVFGLYGLLEVMYVFVFGFNNNGSVFVGFLVDILWFNFMLVICMFFGWFVLMVFVL